MPVDAPLYPVNLILRGRRCLVVGGGEVALRKVEGLVAAEAEVHVVAPAVSDEIKALPVTWDERPYAPGDVAGFRLVVSAADDPAVNRMVFEDGEAAGVWVNAADDPANCSVTLPAVSRRGPVVVAVSTGGHSPALSAWLRRHVDEEMGPEYEVLARMLSDEREAVKAAGRSTEDLDWQKALESGMLELIKAGQVEQARERLQACLSSS
ncbi:MAG TPA: bifunctional precorrin-2 dehydrogenase/sirohydrochlorin ferrochelatase [Acidimicrobiales bacterium]|jgi:precorrin-2 dehydrogenase/sirohydrochlorin ferrochelatase